MTLRPDLPVVTVKSRGEWRLWLESNADNSRGVWVSTLKKAALTPIDEFVSIEDLNRECLCFGWIDSKVASISDTHSVLLCTPRKPTSSWSAVNKARVSELEQSGEITDRGRAVIDAAKANGLWDALNDVEALVVPADLSGAFAQYPGAAENWEVFPRSVKRAILEWIHTAKKPETRATRVLDTAEKAAQNIRANQWTSQS